MNMKFELLVVVRWPLGGIRTYMRYMYRYLNSSFNITIIAMSTQEDEALCKDAKALGARLLIVEDPRGFAFSRRIRHALKKGHYDLIQSHGFISGMFVHFATKLMKRPPHILTVHGILEEKYLNGTLARFKKFLLDKLICNVDVLYGVSNDILGHLENQVPGLQRARCKKLVIHNGIDLETFSQSTSISSLRSSWGVAENLFLFAFMGRFMPQKGFDCLFKAVGQLANSVELPKSFKVLAVGSGDYEDWYRNQIDSLGLNEWFVFMPFQADVAAIYREIDAIVIPSVWEACPLLPMEALVSGVPVIGSNCIGMREVLAQTPAEIIQSGNVQALSGAMRSFLIESRKDEFLAFKDEARKRYDVSRSAESLRAYILENLIVDK